jgi:hypothetical protein
MALTLAGSLNSEKGIRLINLNEKESEPFVTEQKRFCIICLYRLANDENDTEARNFIA